MKPDLLRTHELLLAVAATVFMLLPLMVTISDTLDSFVAQFPVYALLQAVVAPIEARMLAVVLHYLFQIPTAISGSTLIMMGQPSLKVYVSWICVGWQSLALYAVSAVVGLYGPYTIRSKLVVLFAGLEGTFLINLLRETSVILVNMYVGELAAILYHNYGGAIITITWLVLFWYLVYGHVLKHK
jgi:exosortase/archaeosortase family protein